MNETNNWAERTTRAALSGCKKGKSRPTSGGGSGLSVQAQEPRGSSVADIIFDSCWPCLQASHGPLAGRAKSFFFLKEPSKKLVLYKTGTPILRINLPKKNLSNK